jgi:hypothetical protein
MDDIVRMILMLIPTLFWMVLFWAVGCNLFCES